MNSNSIQKNYRAGRGQSKFTLTPRIDATRNTMDAVFNHMLGVQVPHKQFVATDVPAQAQAKAKELGWSHQDAATSA